MTDNLPPISSSWRQAPWGSRTDFFFATEPLRSYSLCKIIYDDKMGFSYE
jgi:hypothetical protein